MPKMKTHRGTAKRFRVTGSGKIMRAKAFKSHILTKKCSEAQAQFPSTRPSWLPRPTVKRRRPATSALR